MAKGTRGRVQCSVAGCERPCHGQGWCNLHYRRYVVHGSLESPVPTPWERFVAKVDKNGPVAKNRPDLGRCWLWLGRVKENGYTEFSVGGKHVYGHRFAYEQNVGLIPDGLVLDHFACDNGAGGCVNPSHVRPVTIRENALRSDSVGATNAAKTHCKWGHPFDEDNTVLVDGTKRGRGIERRCRVCLRQQRRKEAAKRRARR